MAFGMPIWYLERKYAGQRTKVWDLNLLASKPEDILKVHGAKQKPKPAKVITRQIDFKTRVL